MVTVITVLQVNLVMSLLLCVMFLVYLCGIQTMTTDQSKTTADRVSSLIIQVLQTDMARRDEAPPMPHLLEDSDYLERAAFVYQPLLDIGSELRRHKRYHSPRVLLSERPPMQPPPLYLIDDFVGSSNPGNQTRKRRYADHRSYRSEYSVCEAESQWVTDKTSAVDILGRQVTVLGAIRTGSTDVKQYFYETRCQRAIADGAGCLGIDTRHWNSQCKTKHTFVRALTSVGEKSVGWRWIRINTSCDCALSRKLRKTSSNRRT